MKSLSEVIRLINDYYVDEVDWDATIEGAINGMLEELDPHSSYISEKQFDIVKEQFDGEFQGIGIEFSMMDGYITVISPIPGTPSDKAGILSGDKIVKINRESAYKITQKDVFNKFDKYFLKAYDRVICISISKDWLSCIAIPLDCPAG